jgi:hypothetical protein
VNAGEEDPQARDRRADRELTAMTMTQATTSVGDDVAAPRDALLVEAALSPIRRFCESWVIRDRLEAQEQLGLVHGRPAS